MVLHYEADKSQFRDMDGKVKSAVPSWIEAWNKELGHIKIVFLSHEEPVEQFH